MIFLVLSWTLLSFNYQLFNSKNFSLDCQKITFDLCDLYPKDGRMEKLYDVDNKTQCLLFCAFTYTEVCKHFMYHYQSKICEIFNVEIEKVFHGCLTIQGPKYPSLIDWKSEVDPCYVSKSK